MMRGVSHWARGPYASPPSVTTPPATARARPSSPNGASPNGAAVELDPDGQPLGAIEVHREPFVSKIKKRRFYRLPVVRGVIALDESLKIGMKALGISANAQLDEPDEEITGKTWGFTIFLSLIFAIGLFFVLPVTVANFWKDELGNSVLFVRGREADPDLDLPRLHLGDLAHPRPAPGVRVPRRRAQDDLLLRGRRRRSCPSARSALLAPAHALRHQLPADRDDHRRVRIRSDRASRPALADPVADSRDRARRRARLRGDPLGRSEPRASAGCAASCGRACSCRS